MAEEQFFSMFLERLREQIQKVQAHDPAPLLREAYREHWVPWEGSAALEGPVIACDGSLGETALSGGLVIWTARAVAHTYMDGVLVKATPEVGVKAGYGFEGKSVFMKAVELRVLRSAVEEALGNYGRAFALYDGSLYLTFLHYMPYLEPRSGVFQEYVSALISLLELASRNDVNIIGVSKDSNITYLRAHIIYNALLHHGVDVGDYRSIRRIREKVKENKLSESASIKGYLREIEYDTSDEDLYNRLTEEPGFTTPLLLAPQTCYVTHEIGGRRCWKESHLRTRPPKTLVPLLEEVDRLYRLPPIALTYWKPRHGLRTYRLDVPSGILGCNTRCEDMTGDEFVDSAAVEAMKRLVAALNGLDDEAYGIAPLVDVDEIARLARGKYKSTYEPVILEELRSQGHDVKLKKRSARDVFLRRR